MKFNTKNLPQGYVRPKYKVNDLVVVEWFASAEDPWKTFPSQFFITKAYYHIESNGGSWFYRFDLEDGDHFWRRESDIIERL